MVKTAGLYLVPVKGYSKNGHPYLILKRVLVPIFPASWYLRGNIFRISYQNQLTADARFSGIYKIIERIYLHSHFAKTFFLLCGAYHMSLFCTVASDFRDIFNRRGWNFSEILKKFPSHLAQFSYKYL
jgi:hypothetical protein